MGNPKLRLLLGLAAVIIIITQELAPSADFFKFYLWIIAGFFITTMYLNLSGFIKWLATSLLILTTAFIIWWHQPIPSPLILITNLFLGVALGILIDKLIKKLISVIKNFLFKRRNF
jgi:hypothetical protein